MLSETMGERVPTDFVDREEHLDELYALVGRLARGQGSAVVVDGVFGMGKSALLSELARRAADMEPQLSQCRVVHTRCHSGIGPDSLYGTIVEVLLSLVPQEEEQSWFRRIVRATGNSAVRSAPEVLSSLVPGLGPLFAAGREATQAAMSSGSLPGDSLLPYQQSAANQIVKSLLEQARSGAPVLVLVDDVQYIDPSSLMVLDRVFELLSDEPLAFVLGHGTGAGTDDAGGAAVGDLLGKWELDGLVRRRSLRGLPEDAVAELVRRKHAPDVLSARLSAMTRGHPIFVKLCLQEWQPQDGAEVVFPRSLEQAVERRIGRLSDTDGELLAAGAVQGETFFTCAAAEVAGLPHEETMERLRRLALSRHLVYETKPPWWAANVVSDCYRFEHRALQQSVYQQQTTQQRRSRHARSAAALSALPGVESPVGQPLELRLEIARHLRLGGPATRRESAVAHEQLARSVAAEGLSFAEAERHGMQAFTDARALPPGEDRDRRIVAAVELLLSLTEVRWRGQHQVTGGPYAEGVGGVDALAQEAERAAARCGAPELIARTTLLRGKTLLATEGVSPALEKLREAVQRAEDCGDAVARYVATVEYGRQLPKRDLAAGLEQLRRAEEMYAADPRLGATGEPVLQHARNLGEMQLGITLYDSGYLGEARHRLLRCATRLREEPLCAELPIALNYLAQVQIALGAEEEAREVLREALDFEERRGVESGWHAYNGALLALLFARGPERRQEARELVSQAWDETVHTWLVNLVPIVRNLYAEVLIETTPLDSVSEEEARSALQEAQRLAEHTCEEVRRTGMVRSGIAAHSLRSRVLLLRGETAAAVWQSREALRILDEVGDMPALRTEEVLYHAAVALRADGASSQAGELLERARAEVRRKAAHLDDAADRERFLNNSPLNRRILGGTD